MFTIDNRNNMYVKRDAKLCCPFRANKNCIQFPGAMPQADMLSPVGAKRKGRSSQ